MPPDWPKIPCRPSKIGSLFVSSDLEGDRPMPQMEQAHPAQDQTIIFVALELLCSNASGMATTVHPANNGWSSIV
jgi:hypothetical protein